MKDNLIDFSFANDFPALMAKPYGKRVRYLDNAATSLKPASMVAAMQDYYLGISTNVHRGDNVLLGAVTERFEYTRELVAKLINCASNEVVFVNNTTDGVNIIASGLGLKKTDLVILCGDSHHSNLAPWMQVAQTEFAEIDSTGQVSIDRFLKLLELKPAVVALTHCSNVTGIYNPIKAMAKAAKEAGAIVVLDGAQSVPHRKIDVSRLDIDFLCFSAHKMLGPTGVGVLYGRADALAKLQPTRFGGGMMKSLEPTHGLLRASPYKFEAGTPNIGGVLGFAKAIEYILSLGLDVIETHDKTMGQYLLEQALKRDYLDIVSNTFDADRGGIASLIFAENTDVNAISARLSDQYGLVCRSGYLCAQPMVRQYAKAPVLRVSTYFYNTIDDIDYLYHALDEINDSRLE